MCRYCEVSKQVLMGKWGNAPIRKRLEKAGYDWRLVEEIKNRMACPACQARVTRPIPPMDKAPK